MPIDLSPDKARIFRILHIDNLPWAFANGLHCAASALRDPDYVPIGNADLIGRRSARAVPVPPGGCLADYVPFYFTPKSPMLYNIRTGHGGITQRRNEEIAILVSALPVLQEQGIRFLFTDRHAYTALARFSSELDQLTALIDWDILRRHDFARSDSYPDKMERYQAEALVHSHVPVAGLLGVACASDASKALIEASMQAAGIALKVVVKRDWYF